MSTIAQLSEDSATEALLIASTTSRRTWLKTMSSGGLLLAVSQVGEVFAQTATPPPRSNMPEIACRAA